MNEAQAADLANKLIGLLLTNQQGALGSSPMGNATVSVQAAKNLATFRMTLIEELKKQPN